MAGFDIDDHLGDALEPRPDTDAEHRIAQLEDRVSLLEASTSMTYGMLKKVLRAVRGPRAPQRDVSSERDLS